jgi:pyruvate kinase
MSGVSLALKGDIMSEDTRALSQCLIELLHSLHTAEAGTQTEGLKPHPAHTAGARNLAAYVALRTRDLRPLQQLLRSKGLASLEHDESAIEDGLKRILQRLDATQPRGTEVTGEAAQSERTQATLRLFGPEPANQAGPRWMVTWPGGNADPEEWCSTLSAEGMSLVRINGAHGSVKEWKAVAHAAHQVARKTGRNLRVAFDLAGPKLRIASFGDTARIIKVKPRKDDRGRVCERGLVRLVLTGSPAATDSAKAANATRTAVSNKRAIPSVAITFPNEVILEQGDVLRIVDAAGRKRRLRVLNKDGLAAVSKTTRLESRAVFHLVRSGSTVSHGHIGNLGKSALSASVARGEIIVLETGDGTSRPERRDSFGTVQTPAHLACTWPAALESLEVGHRVLFDDGRVFARVQSLKDGSAHLRVEQVGKADEFGRTSLKGEKGINLPDTPLPRVGLTEADAVALATMAPYIDIVQVSFVRDASDLLPVHAALTEFPKVGLVAKIETDAAVHDLPAILNSLQAREAAGVLIARGDLALECGFERLAEVQEEILWLAEAAHLPVIWATQVLESLVTKGERSRAEMTDAARAIQAEAVTLNKGAYVAEALHVLRDLAVRMAGHRDKRRHLLRPLSIATSAATSTAVTKEMGKRDEKALFKAQTKTSVSEA